MTTTLTLLREILVSEYELDEQRLTPDASLEDLGVDSLGTIELLWTVEEQFGINLPSEPAPLATLGEVADYIDQLVLEQSETSRSSGSSVAIGADPGVEP